MNALLMFATWMLAWGLHPAHGKPLIDVWLSAYCATFFDWGLGYYSVSYNTCLPLMMQ